QALLMHILITGICGFVGSTLAEAFSRLGNYRVSGVDNLSREGSEGNRARLAKLGVDVRHGDLRCQSDIDSLPRSDWVIDAAANPSVLAGLQGASTRQVVEHNLLGTVNLLEYCARHGAGFILLSTSRVYSMDVLRQLPLSVAGSRLELDPAGSRQAGV